MASLEPTAAGASILDLYRAVWASLREAIVRYHLAVIVELGMILAWVVFRTAFDVESRPYLLWTVAACLIAVLSPTSGLVILVAMTPFFEPVSLSRALGMRHVLVAAREWPGAGYLA